MSLFDNYSEWSDVVMGHDFLDGIDQHFKRLMKLNGSGRRNGSSRDRTLLEITEGLKELSGRQNKEVLEFVRSLRGNPDQLDLGQSLESESDES
jgi:hypothetical protein